MIRMSVCMSVTLVHPAKAVGWNEMPFDRDTFMVPTNIVLSFRQQSKCVYASPPVQRMYTCMRAGGAVSKYASEVRMKTKRNSIVN